MSKTFSRVYARGYRAGRRLRWWEKLMFLMRNRRTDVEEWITDGNKGNADFYVALFSGLCLAAAGLAIWAASRG